MRLISILDASDNEHFDAVFRTSVFASYIVLIVCLGIAIGVWVPFITDYLKGNVSIWWSLGIGWVSFWCFIIAWIAWLRIKAGSMPTNWLLKLNSDRVLIKFRSFQNYAYPDTDPVVIELSWRDITWVRKTKETSHKDKGNETTTEFFTYLDIRVDLSETEQEKLIQGLKNERKRKPLRSSLGELRHELFKARKNKEPKHEIDYIKDKINQEKVMKSQNSSKSSSKYHDYPVRLVHENILRLRWNSISPNIKKALAILAKHTNIEEEIKFVTDSTKDLSGKALDDMILERIEQGDEFDAIKLIKKYYGYSTTEAMQFISELSSKPTV